MHPRDYKVQLSGDKHKEGTLEKNEKYSKYSNCKFKISVQVVIFLWFYSPTAPRPHF
jgi:hypothetical protein